MKVHVQLETAIDPTFRVKQVAGLFDVPLAKKSRVDFAVHLPANDGDWRIGAIVGASGSGKSTVARQAYGKGFIESTEWARGKAIVDCFPPSPQPSPGGRGGKSIGMDVITSTLSAVGFSSPPAWVLPYAALSTGQRMRCDLALALLRPEPVVAFDEFTSVVDRQVGKAASMSVAKAVRGRRVPLERFVAVTCHYDVLDWLEPDWVLDMADRRLLVATKTLKLADLPRGSLRRTAKCSTYRRPTITLNLERVRGKAFWPLFHHHHYLSGALHPAARCYVAFWDGSPVSFIATLSNAGHVGRRIVHRLVTLPDYQGMGIGLRVLEAVCAAETGDGFRMSIRTSHPALIAALRGGGKSGHWRVGTVSIGGSAHKGYSAKEGRTVGSRGRTVATFEYRPATASAP